MDFRYAVRHVAEANDRSTVEHGAVQAPDRGCHTRGVFDGRVCSYGSGGL